MSIPNLSKCSFSTGTEKQDLKASILSKNVFLLHVVPAHLDLSASIDAQGCNPVWLLDTSQARKLPVGGKQKKTAKHRKPTKKYIIGIGKSKVTEASDNIIFLDSCSSIAVLQALKSKWSSTTCRLNAHHWLQVCKRAGTAQANAPGIFLWPTMAIHLQCFALPFTRFAGSVRIDDDFTICIYCWWLYSMHIINTA